MSEIGKVVGIEDGFAVISMTRTEACAKCRACIAGMSEKEMKLRARNLCGAKIGDYVNIELKEGYFTAAVIIMYGIPLVALLLGFLAGYYISEFFKITDNRELVAFLTGIMFMCFSYFLIKKNEKKINSKDFIPYAVSVAEPGAVAADTK